MSLTGAFLVLFVTLHCLMNGVAIFWPTAYNVVCEFLGANWYALVGSAIIAVAFLFHIVYALWLTVQNRKARGSERYDVTSRPPQVEWASKNMLVLGIVVLAFLVEAYDEEVVDAAKNDVRVVMHFHPALAPFKCAVLPLSKKLSAKALEIQQELSKDWMVDFDETGSIGKRYRREDEIGTPYCITVDFDTVGDAEKAGDNCVTVRDRDTMEQVRLPISELKAYLAEKLAY